MIIYVDIDETICTLQKPTADCLFGHGDYKLAKPLYRRIAKINQLYYEGHKW